MINDTNVLPSMTLLAIEDEDSMGYFSETPILLRSKILTCITNEWISIILNDWKKTNINKMITNQHTHHYII